MTQDFSVLLGFEYEGVFIWVQVVQEGYFTYINTDDLDYAAKNRHFIDAVMLEFEKAKEYEENLKIFGPKPCINFPSLLYQKALRIEKFEKMEMLKKNKKIAFFLISFLKAFLDENGLPREVNDYFKRSSS